MSSSSTAAVAPCLERSERPASSSLFRSPRQRTALSCLLLTVVVLVAYNPVTHAGFLNYDDDGYITGNPHVRAGLTWETVKWAFTTYKHANWHPLTWLSHALDCQMFGLNPLGHHYENVLLHALNAVLLFLLLQRSTGCLWRSLMVAALFALHPINVESVAWVAERKNVLSMMFFLLALYAYGEYARKPGLLRYSAVALLFALGLLAKPQVITLPFLLILWDFWPLGRMGSFALASPTTQSGNSFQLPTAWLLLEKLPLLLLSAASAAVTMKAQAAGGAVKPLSQYTLSLRLENVAISYVRYVGHALWPSKLVVLYPHPVGLYPAWQVAAAAVGLLLITALVLGARRRPYLAIGWFWFLGSLVPMIGLVQVGSQAMADRYAYIPFIGLFVAIVWLLADWAQAHRISTRALAASAVACLLALAAVTYRQVTYWHDDRVLWERALALTHDNYVAHDEFGTYLLIQNQPERAAAEFRTALAIKPNDLPAYMNLGPCEVRLGDLSSAIGRFQTVANLSNNPGVRATAYYDLGVVYRHLKEWAKAKQSFEAALQLGPEEPMALTELGLLAQDKGDFAEAVRQYQHAVRTQPNDVGYLLLAQALRKQGHIDQAAENSQRAAQISPNLAQAEKAAESLLSGK